MNARLNRSGEAAVLELGLLKRQFPTAEECPACRAASGRWREGEVLGHLGSLYCHEEVGAACAAPPPPEALEEEVVATRAKAAGDDDDDDDDDEEEEEESLGDRAAAAWEAHRPVSEVAAVAALLCLVCALARLACCGGGRRRRARELTPLLLPRPGLAAGHSSEGESTL